MTNFEIPKDLKAILEADGYLEDDSLQPLAITVEEIEYNGEPMLSFQALLPVLENYTTIDGYQWERLVTEYIDNKTPELLSFMKGDSDSSACVIWTSDETKFKPIIAHIVALISNDGKIQRILKSK